MEVSGRALAGLVVALLAVSATAQQSRQMGVLGPDRCFLWESS